MKNYYAKVWSCGPAVRESRDRYNRRTTRNAVNVYRFDSRDERDKSVEDYTAPNHCPQAYAEAVNCKDEDVRWANSEPEERFFEVFESGDFK